MVGCAALAAYAASAHAGDDVLIADLDGNHVGDLHSHRIQRLSLRHCTRKAVKDKAVFAIVQCKTILDDTDHDLVRDQSAGVSITLCALSHFGAVCDSLADHIARGDRGDRIFLGDYLRLCTLTCTGRSEQYQIDLSHHTTIIQGSPCNDAWSSEIRSLCRSQE